MPSQLGLRRVKIETDGSATRASYVFPFFDAAGWIAFCLVVTSQGHFVTDAKLQWTGRRIVLWRRGPSALLPLEESKPADFAGWLHFDPWWTMRGANDLPAAVREAVISTNIAGRRSGHLHVRNLLVSDEFDRVAEFWVGDGVFRSARYGPSRSMPAELREALIAPPRPQRT
jgi:hypothetical protein